MMSSIPEIPPNYVLFLFLQLLSDVSHEPFMAGTSPTNSLAESILCHIKEFSAKLLSENSSMSKREALNEARKMWEA